MSCQNANINGSITSNNAHITGGSFQVEATTDNTDTLKISLPENPNSYGFMRVTDDTI